MFAWILLLFFTAFQLFSISTEDAQNQVQKARDKVETIQKEIDNAHKKIDRVKKEYYDLPKISVTGKSQASEGPSFALKISSLETEKAALKAAKVSADGVLKAAIETLKTTTVASEEIASPIITIENKTPIDLYCAVYYSKITSKKNSEIQFLPAGKRIKVDRPPLKSGYDRQVYFSINKEALTEELSRGESDLVPNFNIGYTQGDTYLIVFLDGIFKGYNILDKALQPVLQKIEGSLQKFSDTMRKPLRNQYKNPNKKKKASVRASANLSPEEQAYLSKRSTQTIQALNALTGESITSDSLPRIAICCSGGGYRAMTCALGSLIGLEKSGLLNAVSYMAGLSGSTWTIAPWISMGNSLQEFREQLIPRINKNLSEDVNTLQLLDTLWKKFVFDEPLSTIDVYGGFLGNRLLRMPKKNPYKITLAQQQARINNGTLPLPIYTAIATKDPYEWLEFTPFEVGSNYLGGFIPTWAFGCEFKNGTLIDVVPEQHLGFCMGIWGSAFSANIKETYDAYKDKIDSKVLRDALDLGAGYEYFGGVRILPAKIANPYLGMLSSSRSQQKILTLIDAGLDFNIPMPPLLRTEREIDIIIVFDNSYYIQNAPALIGAQNYAKKKNLPFPAIEIKDIDKKVCSVFKDATNPQTPIIIYMPLIQNEHYSKNFDPAKCILKSYCATENFTYNAKQMMELSSLTEYSVIESAPIIIREIKECIERKKNA